MYSTSKAGVDGATQFLGQLRSATLRYKWQQRVTMDVLFCIATNAVLMYRVWKQAIEPNSFVGLVQFRAACSRVRAFPDCMLELAARLVMHATDPNRRTEQLPENQEQPLTLDALPYNPRKYKRRQYFSEDEGRRYRLTGRHFFFANGAAWSRPCILCGKNCKTACRQCSTDTVTISLCKVMRRGQTQSCFEMFHSMQDLPALRRPRERNSPTSSPP